MKSCSTTLLLVFQMLFIHISIANAQISLPGDAVRSTSVLPPEAYTFKFNSAGSVDFHGDYSANIPLMTVPGRGGMDYPISVSYKAGITTDQRATWVGLGWNLNPGSITRVINGIPDNINHGVIYQGETYITENGAIVHYPPMQTASYQFPEHDHFDYFLVNIPGVVSGLVVPVNVDGDSTADYVFQEINGFRIAIGYTSSGYNSFNRIIAEQPPASCPTTEYNDISHIWVYAPDGTRYIFALPLRSEIILYGGDAAHGGVHFEPRFIVEYVSSWLLTSIISPDCNAAYSNGDVIPLESSTGNWVRFEYNYPYNSSNARVRNIRPLYFNRYVDQASNDRDPFGLLTQTTYLSKIITPTHEAVFATAGRNDISFLSPYATAYQYKSGIVGDFTNSSTSTVGTFIKPLRLDSIVLYQRYPDRQLVSFVKFSYADNGSNGNELCRYGKRLDGSTYTNAVLTSVPTGSGSLSLVGVGKTTLKEIMIADSTIGQFYRFGYTDVLDSFNPPYVVDGGDNNTLGEIQAIARYTSYVQSDEGSGSYFRTRSGRMGYFFAKTSELSGYPGAIQRTLGAAAWSLRTIEYPTGAVDTVDYELDEFEKTYDQSRNQLGELGWWGRLAPDEIGIRVRSISSYDPITQQSKRVNYQYQGGHLASLPINYLRNSNPYTGVSQFRSFLFGYNSAEVEYKSVTMINTDNSRVQTYYSSLADDDAGYDEQYTQANFVVTTDNGIYRGKVLSSRQFDAQNNLRSNASSSYVLLKKYSGFPPADMMLAMNPNNWKYYIGGKRLLTAYTNNKVIDSTYQFEKNVYNPSGPMQAQITVTNYSYNNFNQLNMISKIMPPGFKLVTGYLYACETSPLSSAMLLKNMISQPGMQTVSQVGLNNQNPKLKSQTKYTWRQFGFGIYVDTVKVWHDVNGDGYQTDCMDPITYNACDSPELIPMTIVNSYDPYGNPLSILDVNGITTQFEWDSNYRYAKLTKSTLTVGGFNYAKTYSYNSSHRLSSQTDENGQTTRYVYDGLGRLQKVIGPAQSTLKTYQYNFRNSRSITWSTGY